METNYDKKKRGGEGKDSNVVLPICLSTSAASSGVARGRTPGSLKLARSSMTITKRKSTPPMAGMAGLKLEARNGQLDEADERNQDNG